MLTDSLQPWGGPLLRVVVTNPRCNGPKRRIARDNPEAKPRETAIFLDS